MADVLGVANLYGIATTSTTGGIVIYNQFSLAAEALVSAAANNQHGSVNLLASAQLDVNGFMILSGDVHPLNSNTYLTVDSSLYNPATANIAHLTCQSSVFIIPNVVSTIEQGHCTINDCGSNVDVAYRIEINAVCRIVAGNQYAVDGYWPVDYVLNTNTRATGHIVIYGASELKFTGASVIGTLSMDWTRNNTWKIGEICRIQQQLLAAVLKISKDGKDHLIADDVQPLFQEYSELIFEVQNV